MKDVEIFCDGSSIGNPGLGGWGAVIIFSQTVTELGGFGAHTTNNRMELTAAIEALENLEEKTNALIKTDSQYVINGATKWVFGWEKNGWQTKEKKEVLNKDLWERLVKLTREHTVMWEHVRGHEGVLLNERVDVIANGFARKEKASLFKGARKEYDEFLSMMPKARKVSSSASKKGKAYSYVSLVDGKVMTHATWTECENRVKGAKAKYKKVFSEAEEKILTTEWGK